ncbi:MAG: Threonine synthase [Anaerolineaceae bacterium]|nr:MAG: Threonine synthase [Anaerolineaceae bacterium]
MITCTNCGCGYPSRGLPYQCPKCGGLFDFAVLPDFDPARAAPAQPGIWRWRHAFGLPADAEPVSLGEGNTPLVPAQAFGRDVFFKCEYQNPTGSFKDRGSALIAAWLKLRGRKEAVEDSSGNAGASFAAYAARAGIRARIFVPASASGPKRTQIEAYGADLVPVPGSRSDVAEAVRRAAGGKAAYASHAWLPFNLPGYATAAYEIFEQLGGRLPGAVIVPAGQGGFLLGLRRGFEQLRIARNLSDDPTITNNQTVTDNQTLIDSQTSVVKMVGVQARACAPLWALFTAGREGLGFVAENATLAEGVRVRQPLRGAAVLGAVAAGCGSVCAADEEEILPGREALARLGFYVEPTSAIVWSALRQTIHEFPDPVVVVLTGSGLKYG